MTAVTKAYGTTTDLNQFQQTRNNTGSVYQPQKYDKKTNQFPNRRGCPSHAKASPSELSAASSSTIFATCTAPSNADSSSWSVAWCHARPSGWTAVWTSNGPAAYARATRSASDARGTCTLRENVEIARPSTCNKK